MATYRVVLCIDVDEDDIINSRGEDTLKELKKGGDDYLRAHVESEMGWLEQSFSRVETKSVTRLRGKRHFAQESKSSRKFRK